MAGPYFPPLEVAGQTLAFDHLEPFVLEMATQSRPNGLKIDVRFSNHCFSETFDAVRVLSAGFAGAGRRSSLA